MKRPTLIVRDFAQIADLRLAFGDLTVLVGAQGTGKSLALQWLKTALDGKQIVATLREAGQQADPDVLIDLIFGVGMGTAWRPASKVSLNGREITPNGISRLGNGRQRAFFIPAHRSMLISDGAPFRN